MKTLPLIKSVCICLLLACGQIASKESIKINKSLPETNPDGMINPKGEILKARINTPPGYERMDAPANSFAEYLQTLPLKPVNSEVTYFDGRKKENFDVYEAVVNLKIGNKDLQQCADAVMRLRAEYLYQQQQYDKIHFNFTNGFRVDYSEWMKGKRIVVNGNQTSWKQKEKPSNTYADFWSYMEQVFTFAGTLSLSKELTPVEIDNLQIGDVFIKGGSPGHAVIVVDVAVNKETKQKVFLLAQSYMPAQEIQILKNPNSNEITPWYPTDFKETLDTPEWTFKRTQLMRFE